MKYLVEIEYRLVRQISVHAPNPKLAAERAVSIVSEWKGAKNPIPPSVTEVKGASS